MASHVHLVRHGEVANPDHVVYASLPGFRLTDEGLRQARSVARFLGSQPVVAVWSSPLERALQTAEAIAARALLPVLVHPDLTEWHLGDRWAGIPWEDLPERMPGELEAYLFDPTALPFSPETLDELAARVVGVVEELHERHREGDVVLVGHQDPVQAARLRLTGQSLDRLHTDKPAHGEVITLSPGPPWTEISAWSPEATGAEHAEEFGVGLEGELG